MMKTLQHILFILPFIILLCFSCGKDNPPLEPTAEELILGKWYFVHIARPDGIIQELNECEKDSHYEFKPDGQVIDRSFSHDGSACRGSVVTAEYNIVSDGKKIIFITSDGTANTVNILTLNETTLEMEIASGRIGFFEKR